MLAKTPPMGWNSWDCYGASVTEEIVRKNARYMAEHLKEFGWEYVVVDIQWSEPTADSHNYHAFAELEMDEFGRLIPAANRFPSSEGGKGFLPLSDYVHSLGLKFGIHIMRGIPRQAVHRNTKILGSDRTAREIASENSICPWNTDMYGVNPDKDGAQAYYDSLFALYSAWGVDYIKVDDIANHYPHAEIEMINRAIKNCGRDMVLSLSPGPAPIEQAEHLKQYANMWRITDDFWDKWELLYDMFHRAEIWCTHSGAGHWPDADMLPVGAILQDYSKDNWTKFTENEQLTMLNLWCVMRSPLMIGGDLCYNDTFTLKLLTNADLLEMLSLARSSHQVYRMSENNTERIVWKAFREGGGYYLCIFNTSDSDAQITVNLDECDLFDSYNVFDIWDKTLAQNVSVITADIPTHGSKAYHIVALGQNTANPRI